MKKARSQKIELKFLIYNMHRLSLVSFIAILCIGIAMGGYEAPCPNDEVPVINPGGSVNYYTDCTYACTANDVEAYDFRVVDAEGNPITCLSCTGETATAFIEFKYEATAKTKYNVFFIFGLDKNGKNGIEYNIDPVLNEQYRVAIDSDAAQDCVNTVRFQIYWPCGNSLYLVGPAQPTQYCPNGGGPVVHWDNNAPPDLMGMKEYACSPNSQCTCFDKFTVELCQAKAVDFSICQGESIEDQIFYDAGAKCSGPDGSDCEIIKSSDFDPNIPGTYSYIIRCSYGGCSAEDTGYVTVNPLPVVSVEPVSACSGDATATMEAITEDTVCDGILTFKWYKGTSTDALVDSDKYSGTETENLEIKNVEEDDEGDYRVEVTCSATDCAKSATGTLMVHPVPEVAVLPVTVCVGSPATLEATITSGTCEGIPEYVWKDKAGAIIPDQDGPSLTFPATALDDAGTYTVEVTCSGCTGIAPAVLNVQDKSTVSAGEDITMCVMDSPITLEGTITNIEPDTALWSITSGSSYGEVGPTSYDPDTNIATALFTPTYSPITDFFKNVEVRLSGTPISPCSSAEDRLIITVLQKPVINIEVLSPPM